MITFHTFPGKFGLESLSPFCMKVEVYMKLARLPYVTKEGNPRNAPKGKLPHIVDEGGASVCDSGAILEHFENKHGRPLDKGLDDDARARGHVIKRTLEESLYFVALWSRWSEDPCWEVMKHVFDGLPMPLRLLVPGIARRAIVSSTRAQGIGRHSRDEIYDWGRADLKAVSTLLADGPYILGERLTTYDCTGYAFLANALRFEVDTPLRQAIQDDPRLVSYVERVAKRVAEATAA